MYIETITNALCEGHFLQIRKEIALQNCGGRKDAPRSVDDDLFDFVRVSDTVYAF